MAITGNTENNIEFPIETSLGDLNKNKIFEYLVEKYKSKNKKELEYYNKLQYLKFNKNK